MRTRILGLAVALCLLTPLYATAQDHTRIVEQVKEEMGPAAFTSADSMLVFVLRVLDHLPPNEGLGLVKAPPSGENVAYYAAAGTTVRVNRVIQPNGQIIKILTDSGPGGANGPAWNADDVRPDLYVRYLPSVPPVVVQPPVVVPPIAQSPEIVPLLEQIISLQQSQLNVILQIDNTTKSTNEHVISMDRTLMQSLGSVSKFIGKYVAPAIAGYITAKQLN